MDLAAYHYSLSAFIAIVQMVELMPIRDVDFGSRVPEEIRRAEGVVLGFLASIVFCCWELSRMCFALVLCGQTTDHVHLFSTGSKVRNLFRVSCSFSFLLSH